MAALSIVAPAYAQSAYPAKPITLVAAFAPGGGTDTAARLIAKELAIALGQPVVVDNRAGAGSAIGATSVARAAADGYTLLLGRCPAAARSPILVPLLRFSSRETLDGERSRATAIRRLDRPAC